MTDTPDESADVGRVVNERNQAHQNHAFNHWCAALDAQPSDYAPMISDGFKVDLELQPHRWISAGLDLLQSNKVTARVQLMNGQPGPALNSVLLYPVFQMGSELFLKGMWLCQYYDCRKLAQNDYIDEATRQNYSTQLKDLGHDLLKITAGLRKISKYQSDPISMQFIQRVESIVRQYYFPLHEADKSRGWAQSRYPKRFYKDSDQKGCADSLQSYPQQSLIVRLFEPIAQHIDMLWGLHAGLLVITPV